MAVTNTVAVSPQTAAATSSDITVDAGATVQVWVSPILAADEKVRFVRTNQASPEVTADVREVANALYLGDGVHSLLINGPIVFRVVKPVTSASVGVYVDS